MWPDQFRDMAGAGRPLSIARLRQWARWVVTRYWHLIALCFMYQVQLTGHLSRIRAAAAGQWPASSSMTGANCSMKTALTAT